MTASKPSSQLDTLPPHHTISFVKLLIQVPCYNEVETLSQTVAEFPRTLPGIDCIEWLIIDDGSDDGTADMAEHLGAAYILRHKKNLGLARSFEDGLEGSLRAGADIIVNTDADNQYPGFYIAQLVAPIVDGEADIVIGDRQVESIAHFSPLKRSLQKLGSWFVRTASETDVPDATSGFRAMSREAAMRLFIQGQFSYTLESLIQAGDLRLAVTSVPITTNPATRSSRLFLSIPEYIDRSATAVLRAYAMYTPMKVFLLISSIFLISGLVLGFRFLYFFVLTDGNTGHVQSLIFAAILIIIAFMLFVVGILGDLISSNRSLLEDVRFRLSRIEGKLGALDLENTADQDSIREEGDSA